MNYKYVGAVCLLWLVCGGEGKNIVGGGGGGR